MTSLVPGPVRAVQVTSEGLEPNFPDKLDRWRHIQNRLKTGNKALEWQLSTGSLGTKRKLKQQKGAHSLPAHCQLFPGRKRCSPKNSSTYSGTRKSPLKRRSSFVYLVSVRKDPFPNEFTFRDAHMSTSLPWHSKGDWFANWGGHIPRFPKAWIRPQHTLSNINLFRKVKSTVAHVEEDIKMF